MSKWDGSRGIHDRWDQGWKPSNPVKWSFWVFVIAIIMGIAIDQFFIPPQFQMRTATSKPIENSKTNLEPAITKVAIDYPTTISARIRWVTKQKTQSRVTYCMPNSACGSSDLDTNFKNDHEAIINDLLPNTRYEITLTSIDADQNQIDLVLDNWVITPPEKDVGKPTIISPVENISSQTISWATDENTTGKVILWSELLNQRIYDSIVSDTNHTVQIDPASILPKKAYYYRIIATDTSGNSTVSDIRTYKAK